MNLRMDATYFSTFCMVAYQDAFDGYTQLFRFTDGEHYEEVKEDLSNLIRLGVQLESITADGHRSVLKAIHNSVSNVIVQRCLVPIQRMCLIWLTRFPTHISGQQLRRLVLMLLDIKTENDKLYWTHELQS
ncbi:MULTISPECIES: transposase [Chitinophagaceae]